jgi:hypothetical protein
MANVPFFWGGISVPDDTVLVIFRRILYTTALLKVNHRRSKSGLRQIKIVFGSFIIRNRTKELQIYLLFHIVYGNI